MNNRLHVQQKLTASLVSKVCSSVAVEPELQQLTGEKLQGGFANRNNGARVDVAADGFWGSGKDWTFLLDIRVYNPYAVANRRTSLSSTNKRHKNIMRRRGHTVNA